MITIIVYRQVDVHILFIKLTSNLVLSFNLIPLVDTNVKYIYYLLFCVVKFNTHNYSTLLLKQSKFSDNSYCMIAINRRNVVLYKNYTYSKKGSSNNFYCSKKQVTACPAKLNFDKEMILRQVVDEHNHPPPKLYKTPSGKFIKVN